MMKWFFDWWSKPIVQGKDMTDDELPFEAQSTWDNLGDAYNDED